MTNKEAVLSVITLMRKFAPQALIESKTNLLNYKTYLEDNIMYLKSILVRTIFSTQHLKEYFANIAQDNSESVIINLQQEASKLYEALSECKLSLQNAYGIQAVSGNLTSQLLSELGIENDMFVENYITLNNYYKEVLQGVDLSIETHKKTQQNKNAFGDIVRKLEKLINLQAENLNNVINIRDSIAEKLAILDMSMYVFDVLQSQEQNLDEWLSQNNDYLERWFHAQNITIDTFLQSYSFDG